MKTKKIIISVPAMGKTTLVKAARTADWNKGTGVDFDLKGLNHYSPELSQACTDMINCMFRYEGKTFVTAFNGCVDFTRLDDDIEVYFVAPGNTPAYINAIRRSRDRGDSREFVQSYASHIIEWVEGLWTSFALARFELGVERCHYIGALNDFVIGDYFKLDEEGYLDFINYEDPSSYPVNVIAPLYAYEPMYESWLTAMKPLLRWEVEDDSKEVY